ncbi:hypothetical protein WG66_012496 [Moniliophthora roreri]|nr:hypothetical protein WG66_012496 [Moniliophthora roreri]
MYSITRPMTPDSMMESYSASSRTSIKRRIVRAWKTVTSVTRKQERASYEEEEYNVVKLFLVEDVFILHGL